MKNVAVWREKQEFALFTYLLIWWFFVDAKTWRGSTSKLILYIDFVRFFFFFLLFHSVPAFYEQYYMLANV